MTKNIVSELTCSSYIFPGSHWRFNKDRRCEVRHNLQFGMTHVREENAVLPTVMGLMNKYILSPTMYIVNLYPC